MYRAALVEDEPTALDFLRCALQGEFERQGAAVSFDLFQSGDRFLPIFQEHYNYDMIFLDIEMPGVDGIEVCRQIKTLVPDALVVFISNQESLVFHTFTVQPFRFIRKNCFEQELNDLVSDLLIKLKQLRGQFIYITEPSSGDIYSFEVQHILYVEAQLKDCRIVSEADECTIRCSLRTMEQYFIPLHFLKPHRSYLVNCRAIFYIGKNSVILTNREEIPVSRGRLEQVKNDYINYTVN